MKLRTDPFSVSVAVCLILLPLAGHAASKQGKAEGAALYKTSGCEHCHGANLQGSEEGISLQGIGKTSTRDDLTHQIVKGGGGMPPFREALTDEQIARLVDFLESQKKAPKKSKAATPAPLPPPKAKPDPDDSGQ